MSETDGDHENLSDEDDGISREQLIGRRMHDQSEYIVTHTGKEHKIHSWSGDGDLPTCVASDEGGIGGGYDLSRFNRKPASVYPLGFHEYCSSCVSLFRQQDAE